MKSAPARALQLYVWVAKLPEPKAAQAKRDWLTASNNGSVVAIRDGDEAHRAWIARQAMLQGPRNVDAFHNAACVFCALNMRDDALRAVEQASRYAYDQLASMADDTDLDSIRNTPAFTDAIARGRAQRSAEDVIAAWTFWSTKHNAHPGDTYPAESPEVAFWFAGRNPEANRVFRQIASTGDGSLLALWGGNEAGTAPVVMLGNEGDATVVADDVPSALAIVGAAGSQPLESIIAYGGEPQHNALTTWLGEHFDVRPPDDVPAAVAAAAELHPGLADVIARLNA